MYRFRSIDALLDKFNELENQEIYFASPEELNDPMEGYKDLFWLGDDIVWGNLIKNYIRSLERTFMLLIISSNRKLDENDIHVRFDNNNLRVFNHEIISTILQKLLQDKLIIGMIKNLSNKKEPIRRNELSMHLRLIHQLCVNVISGTYHENGLIDKPYFNSALDLDLLNNHYSALNDFNNKIKTKEELDATNIMFDIFYNIKQQLQLINKINMSESEIHSNSFFYLDEFTDKYINKLETLIYPEWYAASFLKDFSNSAIWGHYADNHKGVCLKFNSYEENNNIQIKLSNSQGKFENEKERMSNHIFHETKYESKHVEIDFFRSLGRESKMYLQHLWYKNEKGDTSNCGSHLENGTNDWREKYWENFTNGCTVKLKEWSYEQEYRLIISNWFYDYKNKNDRKLKYQFESLEAIIFGIKTDVSDKLRIIKIIREKCKNNSRKNFDFYQAYYSRNTGKIEISKLNMIKFD